MNTDELEEFINSLQNTIIDLTQKLANQQLEIDELKEAAERAKELEKERELVSRRTDRYEAGEVILEIALIICSLTLLTKKRFFWVSGIALGLFGVCVALSGFLIR